MATLRVEDIAQCIKIEPASIVSCFITGSRAWGTAEIGSDWDIMVIVDSQCPIPQLAPDASFALLEETIQLADGSFIECNFEVMSEDWFWKELIVDKSNLQAIACLFLPPSCVLKNERLNWIKEYQESAWAPWKIFRATLWKVPSSFNRGRFYCRHAESLANNGQERMGTSEDIPVEIRGWSAPQLVRRAKKMICHAIRYSLFAEQLLKDKKISDLQCASSYWEMLKQETEIHWKYYEDKYRPIYKNLLDNIPISDEDKIPPPDALSQSVPDKYHRLLFLHRSPKQQDSYQSSIDNELASLIRVAFVVRVHSTRSDQPRIIRARLQSCIMGLNCVEENNEVAELKANMSIWFEDQLPHLERAIEFHNTMIDRLDHQYSVVMAQCQSAVASLPFEMQEAALRRQLNEVTKTATGLIAEFSRAIISMQRKGLTAMQYLGTTSPKEFGVVYNAVCKYPM